MDYSSKSQVCAYADLSGDGSLQTLCRYFPVNHEIVGDKLYCFDGKGTRPVGVYAGRHAAGQQPPIRSPYWIDEFLVLPADALRHRQIVVTSNHNWSFPDQVAVLDYRGRLIGEYWHHGHLLHLSVLSGVGQQKTKLVVSGLNDSPGYGRGTVLIFDPNHVTGSSLKTDGSPDFHGLPAGSEQTVIFFPKTRISEMLEFNRVSDVRTVLDGGMTVIVAEGISELSVPYADSCEVNSLLT